MFKIPATLTKIFAWEFVPHKMFLPIHYTAIKKKTKKKQCIAVLLWKGNLFAANYSQFFFLCYSDNRPYL